MNSLKRFLREPIFICLAIGLLLFLLDRWLDSGDAKTITLSKEEVEGIAARWFDQMGREPLPAELAGLIEERAQEEMLLREAQHLGLADADVIVQRRLIQKLRFLVEDSAVVEPASIASLESYFDMNRAQYGQAATISFTHRFWSSDSIDDDTDWNRLLDRLNSADDDELIGSAFMLGKDFVAVPLQRVADDFGRAFATEIFQLDADGEWTGPLTSHYGVHLVRVERVTPAHDVDFDSVVDKVRSDFDLVRREEAFREYLDEIEEQYTVVLP
ncbi:MAG: peptidylprolyl isomerase [Gammaproteobacteria bacterium]|nr:peptidylprolyl isomerase [Gammaproteobacteria bacterium]